MSGDCTFLLCNCMLINMFIYKEKKILVRSFLCVGHKAGVVLRFQRLREVSNYLIERQLPDIQLIHLRPNFWVTDG